MSAILVCMKMPSGLLLPCVPFPEPDGCKWTCSGCGEICCRVSFGVMNGFWRCRCEGELEVIVDGSLVDLGQFHFEQPPVTQPEPEPEPITSDDDFLKGCGISVPEEEDDEYNDE
jgi:hypothetical protein